MKIKLFIIWKINLNSYFSMSIFVFISLFRIDSIKIVHEHINILYVYIIMYIPIYFEYWKI